MKSHDLGGQFRPLNRKIPANYFCSKWIVSWFGWHVAPSCWNHMPQFCRRIKTRKWKVWMHLLLNNHLCIFKTPHATILTINKAINIITFCTIISNCCCEISVFKKYYSTIKIHYSFAYPYIFNNPELSPCIAFSPLHGTKF